MHTPSLIALSYGTAAVVSLSAAAIDARTGRIPNWLTLPAAALAIGMRLVIGGWAAAGASVLGLLVVATIPAIVYRVSHGQAIGGGDVKLFAALGALLGASLGLEVELGAFLLLALFAVLCLAFRGRLLVVLRNSALLLLNPILPAKSRSVIHPESMTQMRMGPAIAVSVLVGIFAEQLMRLFPCLT